MKPGKIILVTGAVIFSLLNILALAALTVNVFESPSIISLIGVLTGFAMFLPMKFIYRNLGSLEEELNKFFLEKRRKFYAVTPVFLLTAASFIYGIQFPLSGLLNLSFSASSQIFFPVKIIYDQVSTGIADLVFQYGRWYLHFLWIYLITSLSADTYRKTQASLPPSRHSIKASILPFEGKTDSDITAEVYVVTGMHGIIRIPESFCKECHLFIRAVQQASEEIDGEVDIQVKSYWTRFLRPLIRGGFHPPVLLVNGKLFSQGYDVPEKEKLVKRFQELN